MIRYLLVDYQQKKIPNSEYQIANNGFTIIELLITTFIIGTVVTGLFGLFVLNLRGAHGGELRVAGIALANEQLDLMRNLPYDDGGTSGGVPAGALTPLETVTRNGVPYTVSTDIRYVDDPFDGVAPLDTVNTDYKQARVSVTWPHQYNVSPVLLITHIAPPGLEGGANQGTLDFATIDASGQPVQQALVALVNEAVNPAISINTHTDDAGQVVLPGLPVQAGGYELAVTKAGYTTAQTLDQTATFFPDPDYVHLSMIDGARTEKTFFIDHVSSLTVTVEEDGTSGGPVAGVAYTLQGTKRIGVDDQGAVVYQVAETVTTNSQGEGSHSDIVWDVYDLTIDGGATGFDIKESSIPLPLSLNPADERELTVTVVPHTESSVHVTVLDEHQAPVTDATVQLTDGAGYDESQDTGAVGQVHFPDLPNDGSYTLAIDAPGFTSSQQEATVAGATRVSVELTPAP